MSCVTLIGMPGSGKSTVGVRLAKALGHAFLDTDLILQQREGMLLQDILDRRGVEAFLDAEEAAISALDCERTVIAPGGSAVCRERAMEHLQSLGKMIYLRVPLDELERRIGNFSTRGIAIAPGQTLRQVFAQRSPLYERYADAVIDTGREPLEQTLSAVLAYIRLHPLPSLEKKN